MSILSFIGNVASILGLGATILVVVSVSKFNSRFRVFPELLRQLVALEKNISFMQQHRLLAKLSHEFARIGPLLKALRRHLPRQHRVELDGLVALLSNGSEHSDEAMDRRASRVAEKLAGFVVLLRTVELEWGVG